MKDKLLPCVFCGSPKVRLHEYDADTYAGECIKCGATGPIKDTERKAINVWNKRRLSKPEEWVVKSGSEEPYFEGLYEVKYIYSVSRRVK